MSKKGDGVDILPLFRSFPPVRERLEKERKRLLSRLVIFEQWSRITLNSLNQGCKLWLSRIRFHASFVGKIMLLPFRCVLSFHLSMSRSCVQSFDSFQANEIQLHVANLGDAPLCGSLGKKEIILQRT